MRTPSETTDCDCHRPIFDFHPLYPFFIDACAYGHEVGEEGYFVSCAVMLCNLDGHCDVVRCCRVRLAVPMIVASLYDG